MRCLNDTNFKLSNSGRDLVGFNRDSTFLRLSDRLISSLCYCEFREGYFW